MTNPKPRSVSEGLLNTNSIADYGIKAQVLDKLESLRQTPQDQLKSWGERPSKMAFDDAVAFVKAWNEYPIRLPDVGLADDGEVNFLWKTEDVYVDLGFYGDGTFSYYAKIHDAQEFTADEVSARVGIPVNLAEYIRD